MSLLKQEIGVILKTVNAQSNIMSCISRSPFGNQSLPKQAANYDGREQARMAREVRPEVPAQSFDPTSRWKHGNRQAKPYPDLPFQQGYRQPGYEMDVDEWAPTPEEFYKLSSTDPGGFRELLAAECISILDKRAREFNEFVLHANDLQEEVRNNSTEV